MQLDFISYMLAENKAANLTEQKRLMQASQVEIDGYKARRSSEMIMGLIVPSMVANVDSLAQQHTFNVFECNHGEIGKRLAAAMHNLRR